MPVSKDDFKKILVDQPELLEDAVKYIQNPELLEETPMGKLASGGGIGVAHPAALDEIIKPEIKKTRG